MVTEKINPNQNSTVGEEMTSKQRQNEEFKKSLSKETQSKLEKLIKKPKEKVSNDKDTNTQLDTVNDTKSETFETTLITVESKNPKYNGFKTKLTPLFKETKQIVEEIYSKSIRLTYNYIQIGNVLTEAKNNLSKDDYEKLIGCFDIDMRTAYRYIRLVKNDNVSKLTMDDMKSMINPSIGKLVKMHSLSDEEFETVLCGDDNPLLSDNGDSDNVYPLSDRIDNKTYDNLKKMTKIEIMKYFLDDRDKLKSEISSIESDNTALIEFISVNNISFDMDETKQKVS